MTPAVEDIKELEHNLNFKLSQIEFYRKKNFENGTRDEESVLEALKDRVKSIDHERCESGEDNPFFVADLGEIYRSFMRWKAKIPSVQPYYAVKCNPDARVIELLASLGANFDCASPNEIQNILDKSISPERIIYANTCKGNSAIRFAAKSNINLTTVDNANELHKLKKYHPNCGFLIRIATDDSSALCPLSMKFGCTVQTAIDELIPLALSLGLNLKGVSFHAGSGAKDFNSTYNAIRDARHIFDEANERHGLQLSILDIGGGFEAATFDQSSEMVNYALEKYFSSSYCRKNEVKLIAEPGRFMVATAFTLATHIIARRDISEELQMEKGLRAMLYINDGVYGNLNCILFDHQLPVPKVLCHNGEFTSDLDEDTKNNLHFSIWGPTCDGFDCVSTKSSLPLDVKVGDWLYFPNFGAYTCAASTSFNGFSNEADVVYVAPKNLINY